MLLFLLFLYHIINDRVKVMKRTKINGRKIKNNTPGRKGVYDNSVPQRAFRLALLGLTNDDLATAFGVQKVTISYWLQHKPEFGNAVRQARVEADSKVAEALYKRAIGYSHPDVHITNYKGDITITSITKHYAPDSFAALKWLTIRQRDLGWADITKMEHSGKIQHAHVHTMKDGVDLGDFSDEELQTLAKLGIKKQLSLPKQQEN